MKKSIADALKNHFKAYDIPKICTKLGLEEGTEDEAFRSKSSYIYKRLKQCDKTQIIKILEAININYGIDLLPENQYAYTVTAVTRKEITKLLRDGFNFKDFFNTRIYVKWNGELEEYDFLKRICDVDLIKPIDSRFITFKAELYQHRIRNNDWNDSYFFEDDRLPYKNSSQEQFFKIICEILHPEVRDESGDWKDLKSLIASILKNDGFEFVEINKISGYSVFGIQEIHFLDNYSIYTPGLQKIQKSTNSNYIRKQIELAMNSDSPSSVTIGKSKELIETTCKYILDSLNISYSPSTSKLSDLNKLVRNELKLKEMQIIHQFKV